MHRRSNRAGARNVLVSLGKVGALLLDEEGRALLGHAPQGKAVNPVGAGDSMVAGFLYSYLQNGDLPQALRMGLLCGSATTFQPWLASKEDILALQKRCPVESPAFRCKEKNNCPACLWIASGKQAGLFLICNLLFTKKFA